VVKVRRAMARGATRLAAATAERCRNMARAIGGSGEGEVGVGVGVGCVKALSYGMMREVHLGM
jgi:hypothetical protein